jgi:hypothetical protein
MDESGDEWAKMEGPKPPFELAVGAPGLITTSLVPGKAWRRARTEDGEV